uniref:RNA polymerase sigma factor n=1 Tax=Acidobacterium capsulatum TaxID=33075 RepID=A0A7V4XTY7_9BACT
MTDTLAENGEARIIAAILAGQKDLFHDLIRPYERHVYVMTFAILKNEADAEEVTQEAFLKAWRALASFRAEARFSTWLVSIALNEARGRLRRKNQAPTDSIDETHEDGTPHVSPALLRDWREIPSEMLERAEVRSLLRAAIDNLPLIYREIFLLRDLEELSVNECAATLGISVSAAKVRLHRARLLLQKDLAPQLKHLNPKRRWFPWS